MMKAQASLQYIDIPKPERPLNPTPLEMIIYNYEVEARKFHNQRNKAAPANECPIAKQARITKSERDWKHLRLERKKIAAHFKMQMQLSKYRESNQQRDIEALFAEPHHPTRRLARNLRAVGEAKPTTFHEAHHIIPGAGRHLKQMMEECRLNLHLHGLGVNDPLNGVWLRNFEKNKADDWVTPHSPSHRPIHTHNYENWIADHFLNDNLPESIFISRLRHIKALLKTGEHPKSILQKQA